MGIDESGGVGVTRARGVDSGCWPGLYVVVFVPALHHRAVLADLDDCDLAMSGDFVECLARLHLGESPGLGLVGEYDVNVFVHYVVKEGLVGLDDIVGGHIEGNDASGFVGHLHRFPDKGLVLNEISFNMEVVVALEIFRLQIFRDHFEGGAHIVGEGSFRIGSGNEDHRAAGRILALEQQGLYSVLLLIALEKMSELVLSDFADECRRHPENGRACDGVGCRTACHVMQAVRFQALENLVPGLHIHELHAALRQMVELEE